MTAINHQELISLGEKILQGVKLMDQSPGLYTGCDLKHIKEIIDPKMLEYVELCLHWLRDQDLPLELVYRRQSPVKKCLVFLSDEKQFSKTPLGRDLLLMCHQIDEWWSSGDTTLPPECAADLPDLLSRATKVLQSTERYEGISKSRYEDTLEGTFVVLSACQGWFENGRLPPEHVFKHRSPISKLRCLTEVYDITKSPIGQMLSEFLSGMNRELKAAGVVSYP